MPLRPVFLWGFCIAAVCGADWTWRSTPLDVTTVRNGDNVVRVNVDWGAQGESIERDPAEVRQQYERLLAWLKSPEMIAFITELKAKADAEETRRAKELTTAWRNAYETAEQVVDLPTVDAMRTRTVAPPAWLRGMPWDVRQALVVAMIDARNPQQVAWATSLRQAEPHATIFALGWTSPKDFTRIQRANATLGMLGVNATTTAKPSADFAADYLVSGLPAVVRFPAIDQMTITEGLTP